MWPSLEPHPTIYFSKVLCSLHWWSYVLILTLVSPLCYWKFGCLQGNSFNHLKIIKIKIYIEYPVTFKIPTSSTKISLASGRPCGLLCVGANWKNFPLRLYVAWIRVEEVQGSFYHSASSFEVFEVTLWWCGIALVIQSTFPFPSFRRMRDIGHKIDSCSGLYLILILGILPYPCPCSIG